MPPMAEPPEELGAQGADRTVLDPEDAPVELDDDGFLVEGGTRRRFPTNLDVWLPWAGALVVSVAAFETLTFLISGTLQAWTTGVASVLPLPRPDGYYSLLLLAGVLLLVWGRRFDAGTAGLAWAGAAACLAAATGGALAVAQLAGNIGAIAHPSNQGFGEPAAYIASTVVGGVGGLADAVIATFAAVLAVLLYPWTLIASTGAIEVTGEGEPAAGREGGGAVEERATSTAPHGGSRGSVGPAVASLLLGAVLAGASLVVFAAETRSQSNAGTGLFPVSGTPVVSVPSPVSTSATILPANYECSSPPAGGAAVCLWVITTEPASPSSSS